MKKAQHHLICGICVFIWGMAMISTRELQKVMKPEILMFWRFLFGYLTLWILYPKFEKLKSRKDMLLVLICGLTSVTLYFWWQNVALTKTSPPNVSIIISIAPLITAVFSQLMPEHEKLTAHFLGGFLFCFAGIILVSTNGKLTLTEGMIGNLLAVLSATSWAVYTILFEKLKGYNTIVITRKVLFGGLITMIPILMISRSGLQVGEVFKAENLPHVLYMGCLASAVCYLLWNRSFRTLGPLKTNAYLYLLPVVTMFCSWIVLKETFTVYQMAGVLMTVAGLFLSQHSKKKKTALSVD